MSAPEPEPELRFVVRHYGGKWYVYDSALCWRVVMSVYSEGTARARAELLNAGDAP